MELLVLAVRNLGALVSTQLMLSFTQPYQLPTSWQQVAETDSGILSKKGNLVEGYQICQDHARGWRETILLNIPSGSGVLPPAHPPIQPAESC